MKRFPHRGPFFANCIDNFKVFRTFSVFSDISQTTQNEKKVLMAETVSCACVMRA